MCDSVRLLYLLTYFGGVTSADDTREEPRNAANYPDNFTTYPPPSSLNPSWTFTADSANRAVWP